MILITFGLCSRADNQKSEGKRRVLFSDAGESTTQRKDTIEENGSRNVVGHVTANAPIETKVGFRGKRAFQMSAHELD
ncbi:hypothetical protein M8C21_024352 [Ambrosia artemisiifolia]|uniref:Uncharacterized protein n=1 Tax=Ambrosia artemisiifolia TaxID=4212 RepID=A0AAD5GNL3_AMBAR|nr:hypothetical protein M8C21_024352 [Ambrosia artemisiifolia]